MEFSNSHLFLFDERNRYRHAWLEHSVQSRTSQSDLLGSKSKNHGTRAFYQEESRDPFVLCCCIFRTRDVGKSLLLLSCPLWPTLEAQVQAQPVMFQGRGTGPVAPGSRLPGRWEREEDPWGCARGGPWPPSFRCCLGHCSGSKLCLPLTPALWT
jgi:hypothetical protein